MGEVRDIKLVVTATSSLDAACILNTETLSNYNFKKQHYINWSSRNPHKEPFNFKASRVHANQTDVGVCSVRYTLYSSVNYSHGQHVFTDAGAATTLTVWWYDSFVLLFTLYLALSPSSQCCLFSLLFYPPYICVCVHSDAPLSSVIKAQEWFVAFRAGRPSLSSTK